MDSNAALPSRSQQRVALVVLTMGDRSEALEHLMASVEAEHFDERHLVVNGGAALSLDGWSVSQLAANVGVPGGRSVGVAETSSEIVVFLDDDCIVPEPGLVELVRERFMADDRLGALGFRIRVLGSDHSLPRWVPKGNTVDVTGLQQSVTFPGGGHALLRTALAEIGGYCDELFFKHEETELSWRLLDAGWDVAFDPACVVEHPATDESRHENALRVGLRNRIWMARMLLPIPLALLSVLISILRAGLAARSMSDLQSLARGLAQGASSTPRGRKPMSWSTARLLSRRGRAPFL